MSNRTHVLDPPIDGFSLFEEGQHISHRRLVPVLDENGEQIGEENVIDIRLEGRGANLIGGVLIPRREGGRDDEPMRDRVISDYADYAEFQEFWEANVASQEPYRILEERAHACRLAYLHALETEQWPLPPPDPE